MLQRTPVMIALSGVLGLGGAWTLGQFLGQPQPTEPVDVTMVVVVSEDIAAWEELSSEQLKTIPVPGNLLPELALTDVQPLVGQYAQVNLFAGEILLAGRISPQIPSALLANRLETGMRAMTVRINDVSGVAGFVQPGSRVDVIANERSTSRLLLTNREVLAIDQATTMENNEPVIARTATLAITPSEATQLAGAIDDAALFLALRNPDEPTVKPKPRPVPAGLILQRGVQGLWVPVNQ
ncbi:Flp pilus assembly protein CpaB [Endozoicomonas atrinae]|uniref:Flp pilus assembly protein CpaB n=1 Tax=Endozoicomonas atrinae TaxID=1333660 RepID=UPI00082549A8|nr:Flp pilus assembly protein CpaB [Endozoicomonas atrinae]